ncbi:MAG TPA: ADP-glyceromanno-heptose 6-epimerase [Rhabdochlamydiaceae bacterium]|nr:ADP-glyceromanno-heptose 6-epimerase [Rhabdochlamydiaceae bacterium]
MVLNKEGIIVVTGAAGFIGSCVVRYLNDKGFHHLVLVDEDSQTANLANKKYDRFLHKQELFPWLNEHAHEVKAIIHLGACSDTTMKDWDYLLENNYNYTLKLAEIALKHQMRFIYASSAATYGDGSLGFSDNLEMLEQLKPLNLYGDSKHLFDLWAKKENVFNQIVGLKYFNVFGPNENHKNHMASMVFKMFPIVKDQGLVRLFKSSEPDRFSDGDQCRDFIYVKDAVRMTCQFLDNDVCGLFNIGRGEPSTWNALAGALFNALNRPANIEYIEMPKQLAGQYQNYTCADMTHYQKRHRSHSICEYNLENAVMDYVQGYLLTNQRW